MIRHASTRRPGTPHDLGFSLVEVVIAMVLFAFLAVAILPLLMNVTKITVQNSELVRAKSATQHKIASLQRDYPSNTSVQVDASLPAGQTRACAALPQGAGTEEDLGKGLTLVTYAEACPAAFPGTVAVHTSVRNASGDTLTAMHTSLRVTQ